MSFEKALIEAANLPAIETTRLMMWFPVIGTKPATKRGAEFLQDELSKLLAPETQVRIACDHTRNGFLLDAIRKSSNQLAMLVNLAEASSDAFRTLEMGVVHVDKFFPEPDSLVAWEIMQAESDDCIKNCTVTEIAKTIVTEHRERTLSWMVEAALAGVEA